ncbi:MAG: winged helix-turn-helix transcriptional regulator [Thermoplasmata archaeon]|nr:MAG: winged helix-turn-helix transcriptional regulator [Thermoplasmata archaeon]
MPILLAKNQDNGKKSIFLLVALVLLGFLILLSAYPVSAQETKITVTIDKIYQTADFTVDESIIIEISGTFKIEDYTGNVYFGIYAPEGWETSITPEETWVPFDPSPNPEPVIVTFDGEIIPPKNAQQEEHNIYVWASIDKKNPEPPDIVSSTSNVFSESSIIEVIQNRVKMVTDIIEQRILPSSSITYSISVTNAATVSDIFEIELQNHEELENEGWTFTKSVDNLILNPGDTQIIYIDQQIPPDVLEGDYKFDVLVSSSQHASSQSSQTFTTKVRVPEIASPFQIDWMLLFMVGFVGCGIGIAAFLGATEVGYFSLISLFLPLYVRLKKKDVLSHFTRGQIFGYIQANPGTHYNAIIQDLRLHNGVGAYHLQVLEREGFIRSLRDGIYKRFYPSTMRIPEKRLHLSRIQRDIFEIIQKHPGITQKQISKLLDESKQVVNYHVKILEGAGLIRLERAGRETACYAGKVKYVPEEDVYQLADETASAQVMRM